MNNNPSTLTPVPVIEPDMLKVITEAASRLAKRAHAGQKRNKSGKDYFTHPEAVANLVEAYDKPIAYLHDVLEDTSTTAEDLRLTFPAWIVDRVVLLTREKGGSYFDYVMAISYDAAALRVKMADLEHNLSDLEAGNLRDKYLFAYTLLSTYRQVSGLYFNPRRTFTGKP